MHQLGFIAIVFRFSFKKHHFGCGEEHRSIRKKRCCISVNLLMTSEEQCEAKMFQVPEFQNLFSQIGLSACFQSFNSADLWHMRYTFDCLIAFI